VGFGMATLRSLYESFHRGFHFLAQVAVSKAQGALADPTILHVTGRDRYPVTWVNYRQPARTAVYGKLFDGGGAVVKEEFVIAHAHSYSVSHDATPEGFWSRG
jgi:hypothetical protein